MYCLGTGAGRTEEHLIPRSLGGRATLRDAVCEPCRRLTGRLEQLTLERDFAVPRTLLALKRRRARGQGPARLPAVALEGAGDAALTPATFPRGFWLPAFEPAGLLAGVDRTAAPPRTALVACHLNLGSPTRPAVAAATPPADAAAYAHAIAKWAYALAVAQGGLQAGDSQALRDLLLGRRDDVFTFVGSATAPASAVAAGWLHDYALHEVGPWRVVTLALFASAGMTPYQVVVGRTAASTAASA